MTSRLVRARRAFARRVLGVEDTPHRIAWGVFLGFVIAFTPTIGFQIALYLAIATLLRANKVSGVPFLFISNPVTAVPLYWFTWKVGEVLLRSDASAAGPPRREELLALAVGRDGAAPSLLDSIATTQFWEQVGHTLLRLGGELWIGGVVIGLVTGVPAYFATIWAVRAYRARRAGSLPDDQTG